MSSGRNVSQRMRQTQHYSLRERQTNVELLVPVQCTESVITACEVAQNCSKLARFACSMEDRKFRTAHSPIFPTSRLKMKFNKQQSKCSICVTHEDQILVTGPTGHWYEGSLVRQVTKTLNLFLSLTPTLTGPNCYAPAADSSVQ